ncbi:MAG TPA: hypothetical protein VF401_00920 [Candidatus Saccharimonadales bacterium]
MSNRTSNPLKIFIVMFVSAVLLISIAELLFTLPGARLPWGGNVTSCALAEGSKHGWPFTAMVPGCGSESSNQLAFVLDVVLDFALASFIVGFLIRVTGVTKRGRHE